jgi:hypothetical protein
MNKRKLSFYAGGLAIGVGIGFAVHSLAIGMGVGAALGIALANNYRANRLKK